MSIGSGHDSYPFDKMCRNLADVQNNILVPVLARAGSGTLILIAFGGQGFESCSRFLKRFIF
jgi:hypothetical protein